MGDSAIKIIHVSAELTCRIDKDGSIVWSRASGMREDKSVIEEVRLHEEKARIRFEELKQLLDALEAQARALIISKTIDGLLTRE